VAKRGGQSDCGPPAVAAWLHHGNVVIEVIASLWDEVVIEVIASLWDEAAMESLTASRGRDGGLEFNRKLIIRAPRGRN
jgi:hypothetical protein